MNQVNADRLAYVLVLLFGASSWVGAYSLMVETPLLMEILPEGQSLGSMIVILIQVANVGPIIYASLTYFIDRKKLEIPGIHVNLGIATTASFLSIFLWDTVIGSHSIAFLTCFFFFALVCNVSYLVYNPYMSYFDPKYLMYYYMGQGLGALVPSFVALSQGVGEPTCVNTTDSTSKAVYPEPRFSVTGFMVFLTAIVVASWVAFGLLEKLRPHLERQPDDSDPIINSTRENGPEADTLSERKALMLIIMNGFVCSFKYGVLLIIQPNSVSPYGNLTYQFANSFSFISQPVTFFAMTYCSVKWCRKCLPGVALVGLLLSLYIFFCAALSPFPPLYDSSIGRVLIVGAYVLVYVVLSVGEASVAKILRATEVSHRLLYWAGISSQVFKVVAVVILFVLINYSPFLPLFVPCN